MLHLARRSALCLALCLALCGVATTGAQTPPDTTIGAALRNLASRSGLVFVGQVERIDRKSGVVEITFRIDQTVLGANSPTFVLREWAGLWPPGQNRYLPGQRAMVFLHAPNSAGISSPVDGMEGVVPLIPQGANAAPLLDIRRLASRILRSPGTPLPDAAGSAITLPEAAALVTTWKHPIWREPILRPLPIPTPRLPIASVILLSDPSVPPFLQRESNNATP